MKGQVRAADDEWVLDAIAYTDERGGSVAVALATRESTKRVRMTPAEARAVAALLLSRADAVEMKAPRQELTSGPDAT